MHLLPFVILTHASRSGMNSFPLRNFKFHTSGNDYLYIHLCVCYIETSGRWVGNIIHIGMAVKTLNRLKKFNPLGVIDIDSMKLFLIVNLSFGEITGKFFYWFWENGVGNISTDKNLQFIYSCSFVIFFGRRWVIIHGYYAENKKQKYKLSQDSTERLYRDRKTGLKFTNCLFNREFTLDS